MRKESLVSILVKMRGERQPNMARKWTDDEIIKLRKMFDEGIPDVEIAKLLNRTKNAVHVKRNKLGIADIHKRRFTSEGKEKMRNARKRCTMENSPSWKGGKREGPRGYIEIYMPEHHRARGNGYVFEHIVVMEKKLGRKIKANEHVHHINENKQDNRPENLEVMEPGDHARLHAIDRRTGVYKACVICGKEFYRKPSHAKRAKCCSQKCVGKYTNLKIKGEIAI